MVTPLKSLKKELESYIIGHKDMIEELLIALLSRGHILIEGVPGLAKTTAIKALASTCGVEFKRVQFTPDLLPSDIIGGEIFDPKEGGFKVRKGPIFTNMLLCDEINRAPAKVQSSLLEVMEERQVTIGEKSFPIDSPFMVLATQNPIESQGAYELPEAQLDRFMLKSVVSYNSKEDELKIAKKAIEGMQTPKQSISKEEIERLQNALKSIHMDEQLERYAIDLVDATRNPKEYGLAKLSNLIEYGSGTRGSIALFKASRALAMIEGRDHVEPEDIQRVTKPTLRHRVILTLEAELDKITSDELIEEIVDKIDVP